jgi:hypothetical protein
VPFVESQHTSLAFTDLPGPGTIRIFTTNGQEIARLSIAAGETIKQWDVRTSAGKKLASGVYFFEINAAGEKTRGKIVVIR